MPYKIPSHNRISPKAEIKEAKIHGKGLFAKETIKKGEKVLIWGGDNYVNKKEAEHATSQGKLVMQWDNNLFSIEDRGEDDGYFINHSCNGNLRMQGAFTLVARRTIEAGEEITADYVLREANEDKISRRECRCGDKHCRGKVTGKDYQNKQLQKIYKHHFSPLINKRIKNFI